MNTIIMFNITALQNDAPEGKQCDMALPHSYGTPHNTHQIGLLGTNLPFGIACIAGLYIGKLDGGIFHYRDIVCCHSNTTQQSMGYVNEQCIFILLLTVECHSIPLLLVINVLSTLYAHRILWTLLW